MPAPSRDRVLHPTVVLWMAVGLVGFALLPWYAVDGGFWSFAWAFDGWPLDEDAAPALFLVAQGEKLWLAPLGAVLLLPLLVRGRTKADPAFGRLLVLIGVLGLAWLLLQGFAIGLRGWRYPWLTELFGELDHRQFGMGYGALLTALAFLFLLTLGIAARGAVGGDVFVVGSIGFVVAAVALFVFMPIVQMLANAFITEDGGYAIPAFAERLLSDRLWSLGCLTGGPRCGVAWNSFFLAVLVGIVSTLLGLAFALVATRTGFRFRRTLRALTVLPIITPAFVIGLAVILLFGLSGVFTQGWANLFGVQPTRWVYGLPGLLIAQTLAFTPIAFLVLIGVVEGVSPSMEEAAQTLRASRWQTFLTVTLPLMRPGLANAFLLGFIESMADFGNPLVLGGNFDVLSTEIFFAIVGAQNDPGMAATLAVVLLFFTLAAFYAQRSWLGRRSYTTVSGKGDAGIHPLLPAPLRIGLYAVVGFWVALTLVIYGTIVYGSFVKLWGVDMTLTLTHYVKAFGVDWTDHGLLWRGSAWSSFWTTIWIALVSAPFTAAIGLLTAWLLVRQDFGGKRGFEFGTMLSFAIPGTVIGVSYIIAFNVPPIELTGTGIILVISFIFRNMPVGVRAGVASMAQIDKSLDESSLTLGASSFATLRRVVLPLLKPAILAALVYSFVRAMTAISAVIFLVSGRYDMATSYIVGRVENNEYGVAIAYATVLILVMLAVIGLMQIAVGRRSIGRRSGGPGLAGMRTNMAPEGVAVAGGRLMGTIAGKAASVVFDHVTKVYPGGTAPAVNGVSFAVAAGSLVTLLGPSGCGKTTTLRMIAGLEMPTAGRILIGGAEVTRLPATDRDVSMVFQSYALFPHMTVMENVSYGLRFSGHDKRETATRAADGLALVGLTGLEARFPSELSGGQQQRVAVARALVLEPQVLLFDEPLSNLDARLRRRVRDEIRELQQKLGLTVVYVTHDQEEALAVSDRIIVMDRAVIAQEGSPRDLYDAPDTAFVADFIGESNVLPCEIVTVTGDTAEVRAGPLTLALPARGLSPGPARLSVRPDRLAIVGAGRPEPTADTLPGTVTKTTYAGSHSEVALETAIGPLFLVSAATPPAIGARVEVAFAPAGPVLLLA